MKVSVYKKFKNRVVLASENDPIWYAGFYFINLTSKQAEDLRRATVEKWGDSKGTVYYPNGVSIMKLV